APSRSVAGPPRAGHPPAPSQSFGQARAVYSGTRPDPAAMGRILRAVWTEAGVKPVLEAPAGVSAVRRSGPRSSLLFLLNHRDAHVEIPIADPGVNLVDGSEVHRGLLRLGTRGVAVIREGW